VTTNRKSPTVGRRRLGAELRKRRERAGLSLEVVAERLECSQSKVSRIETGHTAVNPRDVKDLLTIYGTSDAEIAELISLARESREKGWWHPYSAVLTSAYVDFETAASHIRMYEQLVIPGLLQTEGYMRASIRGGRPDFRDDEISAKLRIRMARQSLLSQDDPIDLWVVLDEAVVSRPVGGDVVMREQLRRLVVAAELPNVTIQFLPFEIGAHAGMDGTFAILDFAEPGESSVVFAENATGGLFIERPEELRTYNKIFNYIRDVALPPKESAEQIAKLAKEPLWKSRPRATG
jgi:transcriptional regulator with XRE-family HTH domain